MTDISRFLQERVKHVAPGYYTERDGGDWYCVTPDHCSSVAEGFARRDDAPRCLCWLAGDPQPQGWRIVAANGLSADLDCGQGSMPATVWLKPARDVFPRRPAGIGGRALAPILTPH